MGPRPDGTIPDEAAALLRGLGGWLEVNGEAVYGTRHWEMYGEGDARVVVGHLKEKENEPLTAADIRFTSRNGVLYAICPEWPGRDVTVKTLHSGSSLCADMIIGISMLGSAGQLEWSQDEQGLRIRTPVDKPCEHAYTFKIELKS